MAAQIDTLVIVDDMLETFEGHPYEYDKSVAAIFAAKGIKVAIYGNQKMLPEIKEELSAKPWFHFNSTSFIRKIPILGAIIYRYTFNKAYQQQMAALIADADRLHGRYALFISNAYWYTILPIAGSLSKTARPSSFLYRCSIYDTSRVPGVMKPLILPLIRYAVKAMNKRAHISYLSDSDVIAGEWESAFNRPMSVLPIPHLNIPELPATGHTNSKLRLYLPGGMRLEKGAKLLSETMALLCAQFGNIADKIVLVTQFVGNDEELLQYKSVLNGLPLENIFLGRLSTEEYYAEIAAADIILIPYQASEGYRARTSGILAEAIAAEKPVITTTGTWMSDQVKRYNAGLVSNETPADFAHQVTAMVSDYPTFKKNTQQAAKEWADFHSKDNFYKILMGALLGKKQD